MAVDEDMAKMAEAFASFPEHAAHALDFSPESLQRVDALILEATAGMEKQHLSLYAIHAGAYLGEVIRRRAPVALAWIPPSEAPGPHQDQDRIDLALLRSPKDLVLAPLAKPFKLIKNGMIDSLAHFAKVAHELLSREATRLS